ncbi:hypothetical protein Q7P37_009767 [Cladosporium fusiforme]
MAYDSSNKSPAFVVATTLNAIAAAIASRQESLTDIVTLVTDFSAELDKLKPAFNFRTPRTNASIDDGIRTDEQPYLQLSEDDLVTVPELSRVGRSGKRYTLHDLSQACILGKSSNIENLNPGVTNKLISDCVETWGPPTEDLLVAVDGKLREFVHQVINEHMDVHRNTYLYSEVGTILTGLVDDAMEKVRYQVQYQLELHQKHITTCDNRFPKIHENRKVFKAARDNQRLKEQHEARTATERLESNKRRRTLDVPSEQNQLRPDEWNREIDVAAYMSRYYNHVFPQFVDNVLRTLRFEDSRFRDSTTILSTLVERLNLRDDTRCVELLAEGVVGSSSEVEQK